MPCGEHPPERAFFAQQMVLPHDLFERLRAQPVREGARGSLVHPGGFEKCAHEALCSMFWAAC
ncbi:MAG: hypothetical protein AMXMBFR74_32250 [Parvibaculum sp.]